jgi:hypothetical protein
LAELSECLRARADCQSMRRGALFTRVEKRSEGNGLEEGCGDETLTLKRGRIVKEGEGCGDETLT